MFIYFQDSKLQVSGYLSIGRHNYNLPGDANICFKMRNAFLSFIFQPEEVVLAPSG